MKLLAKGNTAEIYEYDEKRICKLFYPGYSKEYVRHEFHNATVTKDLGIRTPKAHELIVLDGREGIIYDRIRGEDLSDRMELSGEASVSVWTDKFVEFHKKLLQCEMKEAMEYKDFLRRFADNEETIDKINSLADGNCFIHGDFHLGNVIVDEEGEFVLVDMMNVCKGPALYDVARTYFLLGYDPKLQKDYLERMGYTLESILPYLEVIAAVRKNEMMV